MYPQNRPPIKLEPVYQPFSEDKAAEALPIHDAGGLPPFLTQAEPEPEENPALTLKTLPLDLVPTGVSGRFKQQLSEETQKLLRDYSVASGDTCRRCNNSGISGYKSRGSVAVVCRCVRKGALATEIGKAVGT